MLALLAACVLGGPLRPSPLKYSVLTDIGQTPGKHLLPLPTFLTFSKLLLVLILVPLILLLLVLKLFKTVTTADKTRIYFHYQHY